MSGRSNPLWSELPTGMTISCWEKGPNRRAYLAFRCQPYGSSTHHTAKWFQFSYDTYDEQYDKAIDWIINHRHDYIEPRKRLTRLMVIRRLGLKTKVHKRTVLTFE